MKKALIINGYEEFEGVGENKLNKSMINFTESILTSKGYEVRITEVTGDYNPQEEHDKILDADVIFVQSPIYWFSIPGAFKTYIDKVFLIGYATGSMSNGDGRTRSDINKKYGSGGKLLEKKYMVSTTWNAPESAFNNENEFMDGLSIDDATNVLHKTFQFCGIKKMPSFAIHDVFKSSVISEDIENFKKHIETNF